MGKDSLYPGNQRERERERDLLEGLIEHAMREDYKVNNSKSS